MAQPYLDKLSDLIEQTTSGQFKAARLECKHFFSGAAAYADKHICITLTPAGLALKLPEAARNELLADKGAKALRYFPDAPIKKDYVVLPDSMLEDGEALRFWMKASIEYVLTLPESTKATKK